MIDYSEKHEAAAKYMPTPQQIERMKRLIRLQNEEARQGKKYQPNSDDDCDSELEDEADRACRRGE